MAAIVGITSIAMAITIEAHHRNQPSKSKLALYKLLLHFYSHLKQLYMSSKTEHFIYRGRCGIHKHAHTEAFKRIAGLGYR